jgi:CheY-like chemotaxis protein
MMQNYKVLLADDSAVVRTVVAQQLMLLDIVPDLAEDGLQAVSAVQNENYDLIFMDVMMPNLDGIEATKRIREFENRDHRTRTPIIGVTGYTDRAACIAAGMDDFLFKPVSVEQLRGAVKNWIPDTNVPIVASTVAAMFSESDLQTTQGSLAELRIADLKRRLGFPNMTVPDSLSSGQNSAAK